MDRNEHLQWCKDRAYAYLDVGNTTDACASFLSDMSKHDETASHSAIELMFLMQMQGSLETVAEIRKFIEGFN